MKQTTVRIGLVTLPMALALAFAPSAWAQAPDAFHAGTYVAGNLLYTPVPNMLVGGEFQWGRRENFSDGWTFDDYKIQFVFKYSFSHGVYHLTIPFDPDKF